MINIIFEDNHLLVVEKPVNMPVCLDSSKDQDLLSILKADLKSRYQKQGNVYLALIHRLDRPVGGLMVFAKTSKAASRLSQQIRQLQFSKKYLAVVQAMTLQQETLIDYLVKDAKTNIVQVHSDGKKAILHYQKISQINDLTLVEIELVTGRSHQIRIQLSYHNYPIWGDQKYNHQAKVGQQIALYASHLAFNHPVSKEPLFFNLTPKQNPFSEFIK